MNKKLKDTLLGGIVQNPVFILVLGICSALAATTTIVQALTMSMMVTAVLVLSSTVISLLRNIIPDKVRIPAYIVIIASFVTIVDMVMGEFAPPELYDSLSSLISLITVNCIIFARAEGFAKNNSVGYSALDGLSMGVGYTIAMFLVSFFRELFGAGQLFGKDILVMKDGTLFTIDILGKSAGAFIVLACLIAGYSVVMKKVMNRKKSAPAETVAETTEVTE